MMSKHNLSLTFLSKMIIKRQIEKNAGTNVVIYGAPRTGKTNLGLLFLISYIRLMKQLERKNKSAWKIPRYWKDLFKNYFAVDCEDMVEKIKKNPKRSFSFVDEGDDLFAWMSQMEKNQVKLTQLMLKAGFKELFNIIMVPSMKIFSKAILSQAQYLLIIPNEPGPDENGVKCNYAYILRNHNNPILKENVPFNFKTMEAKVLKMPVLGQTENFENIIRRNQCYIGKIKFRAVDQKIYDLYEKLVKEPLFYLNKEKGKSVSYARYKKLDYFFKTLLHNLYSKEEFSLKRMERNMIDKFGDTLITAPTIQKYINRMAAIENKPKHMFKDDVLEDDAS